MEGVRQTGAGGRWRTGRRHASSGALVLAVLLAASLWATAAAAGERAWVRGGIRLNLRTEPGTQFRILGVIATGDGVEILERTEGWTKVQLPAGESGWIPVGYLQAEPPPTVRLEQIQDELTSLQAKLEAALAESSKLKTRSDELESRDDGQQSEISRLDRENTKLKAQKRWPEWITGASVLAAGMLLGAILHRNSTRRPSSRVRL